MYCFYPRTELIGKKWSGRLIEAKCQLISKFFPEIATFSLKNSSIHDSRPSPSRAVLAYWVRCDLVSNCLRQLTGFLAKTPRVDPRQC